MNSLRYSIPPSRRSAGATYSLLAAWFLGSLAGRALADDWGAYSIVPAGAPGMVLEAVGAPGVPIAEGATVSIGKPAGSANQKWVMVPKGDNFFVIKPTLKSNLALAVAKGGDKNGAPIVLETESGVPWQLWALNKNDNGTYSLVPKHAATMGIDDNGGKQEPGAKID